MRCRFCGSKSLHEDTQHKTFSTGKAVAGAVVFGVYGAAAGFIGKDKKGYRCGACGQFMDAPMDFFTEGQIDTAIREAESGRSRTMFDYYHNQYANIQANIPAALPTSASTPAQEIIYQPMIAAPAGTTLKRSYRYGLWEPDCPIWVEGVILKTAEDGDKLSLAAWNLGKETVRSVYFLVKVFDDTGDQVSECRCVYQGLSIPRGGQLPEEKEFPLNTDLAYRVELSCEKAALEGDAVWRQEAKAKEHSLPEQPELSEENFPRLKYANPKYSALKTDREHYKMPIQADGFWLCCCGMPVREGQQCPRCGDTWEHVELCFSQPYLMERQQKAVRERAAKRATALGSRLESVKRERAEAAEAEETARKNKIYNTAATLQKEKRPASLREAAKEYEKISGWRDADEQARSCLALADEIEEKERVEEEERREREAKEAAERKRKTKKTLAIAIPAVVVVIAAIITIVQINSSNRYKQAETLLEAGEYKAAAEAFVSLGNYKDSAVRAKYDVPYQAALYYLDAADQNDGSESNSAEQLPDALEEILEGIEIEAPNSISQSNSTELHQEVAAPAEAPAAVAPLNDVTPKALTIDDIIAQADIDNDKVIILYHSAERLLNMVNSYADDSLQIQRAENGKIRRENELIYAEAEKFLDNGDIRNAFLCFDFLGNFQDSEMRLEQILQDYPAAPFMIVSEGEYISFGSYEQDNNKSNGKEDIEWLVLEKQTDRILVISRYALDSQRFNEESASITWATCTLRSWLNDYFLNEAFTETERSLIYTARVSADKNPMYETSAGVPTSDKIFLLSVTEVEKYFSSEYSRECKPTSYTVAQGGKAYEKTGRGNNVQFNEYDNGYCFWGLRTPGSSLNEVMGVRPDGVIAYFMDVNYDFVAVRPALWIDLGD